MIGAVAINAEDDLIFVGPVVLLKYFSTCRKALKEKYSYAKNYRMGLEANLPLVQRPRFLMVGLPTFN